MARGNERIRKAHTEIELTTEQIQEVAKCYRDPIYFCKKYIKVQHPKKGAIPLELYDYQEEMIRMFIDERYSIVLSARQTGKQISLDEELATPIGFTTMGNINVGDKVLGGDGKPTTVTWMSEIDYAPISYDVHFSTGEIIKACADHQWAVNYEVNRKSPNYKRVMTTQQMVDQGVVKVNTKGYEESLFSVDIAESLELPHIDLPLDPYVLGAWLGDGTSARAEITSLKTDTDLHNELKKRCGVSNVLFNECKTNTNVYSILIRGELPTQLSKLELRKNKHIPRQYFRASAEQRLDLLRGLMDTDGYSGNGSNCELSFSNEELANDAFELICTLGIKATRMVIQTSAKPSHRINFTAYRNQHPIFYLQRKLNTMKISAAPSRLNSTKKRMITAIVPCESVPMRCISVDNEDHTYLVGRSLIKTHNSTVSAIFLLWFAMFHKDKTILIASNKNKGAMEMIQRIRFAYEELPVWLKPGVQDDLWNKHACGFDNGSRIESTATTESSGRGMSISLLYLDEFAFVKPIVQEEFWTSILPTLSTGGACIMSSTPNGDANLFAQLWRAALNKGNSDIPFVPIHVTWDRPPGRDEEFKKQQIQLLGEQKWRQEYLCEFLSSEALLIDSRKLLELVPMEPLKEYRDFKFWAPIYPENAYIVTVDPSTGSGCDYSVIDVYHFPTLEQVAQLRTNDLPSPQLYSRLKWVLKGLENKACDVYFTIENNGVGEGLIALYQADEHPPEDSMFVGDEGKRPGMSTIGRSKLKSCIVYKELIESDRIKLNSPQTILELKTYIRKAGSYQAQVGATDDCVAAGLLLGRVLQEISTYEEDAFDTMYRVNDDGEVYHIADMEQYGSTPISFS